MNTLEERVVKIEERNKSVTLDKAWETSWFRRIAIALLTYVIVALFLKAIGVQNAWIAAIVPVIGYILSTLTIGFLKSWWITNQ